MASPRCITNVIVIVLKLYKVEDPGQELVCPECATRIVGYVCKADGDLIVARGTCCVLSSGYPYDN